MCACVRTQDLLNYARATNGLGAKRAFDSFDLKEAMQEAMDVVLAAHPKPSTADFRTSVVFECNTKHVVGDKRRIVQVLTNLLSNAFKATTKGSVSIRVRQCDCIECDRLPPGHEAWCIEVADTGSGMSELAIQKHLSTPFAAGFSTTTTTGLGFGIVRHTVEEILGGKLRVSSVQGFGTTVHIALPLKPYEGSGHGGNAWMERTALAYEATEQFPILVVDDHEMNKCAMVSLLGTCGHTENVDEAEDGDVALAMIDARHLHGLPPYSIVFMDVSMNRMDGDQAAAALRAVEAEEGRERTYVVGLSAYGGDAIKHKCLNAGMDQYCSKPMQLQKLQDLLLGFCATCGGGGSSASPADSSEPDEPTAPATPLPSGADRMTALIAQARRSGTFEERMQRSTAQDESNGTSPCPLATANIDTSVLDLASALQGMGGNKRLVRKMLEKMVDVETGPMSDALDAGDWDVLTRLAHSAKGTSGYVHAHKLQDAALALQNHAAEHAAEHAPDGVARARELIGAVEKELASVKAEAAKLG